MYHAAMRLIPVLLLLTVMPACGSTAQPAPPAVQPPARAVNFRDSIVALVAHEQAIAVRRRCGLCVVPDLAASLGSARGANLTSGGPAMQAHWFTMPTTGDAHAVDPALSERLDRLMMAAQREAPVTGPAITADMVPSPVRLGCRDGMDSLSFSTPVLVEDVVFIETGHVCGAHCGNGSLVAMQRQGGRWIPVAGMGTWIS